MDRTWLRVAQAELSRAILVGLLVGLFLSARSLAIAQPYCAYVTSSAKTVSVIDTATNTVETNISLPDTARTIAIASVPSGCMGPFDTCAGDCDATDTVAINNIVTLVNIVLGNAPSSMCSHGIPSGADVDVALIIRAVTNALNGCGPISTPSPTATPRQTPMATATFTRTDPPSPSGTVTATGVSTPAKTPTTPAADWVIALDPSQPAGALAPALLGQYDLSGALFNYDQRARLPPLMKAAGMAEWRVGVGRWEFGTQLLPALTNGTSCLPLPPEVQAPPNTTDLDLIRARDWFTYTDGTPVTLAMTGDDSRYKLDYVRSVLDVAAAFGAEPYLDIDHMPRALAANQTPSRTDAEWMGACGITWTNKVSNVRPVDPNVFAAAVVGLVKRIVEGSGGQPGRPVRYWEFWNEPELAYSWNPHVGDFGEFLQTAVTTLSALDAYRKQTANVDGQAIRIGLGSFASTTAAAIVIQQLDAPFDFVSFHSESHDDPLGVVADIETVAAARQVSATHRGVELALSEWTQSLSNSTLDPNTMAVALHHATVIALGAAAGLTHAHHAIFWDFYGQGVPGLGILNHDFSPKPAYYAYTLLAKVIVSGSSRLAPTGNADGKLDGGMGAVLASKDASGKVRILLVNRNAVARTARIDLPTGAATPTSVRAFADPKNPPVDVAPSTVIAVPARSIVLVELRTV